MLLANDEESSLKEASCADKKTCSRSIGLSQRRLHHGGPLVHLVDLVCKSRRRDRGIRPADLPGFIAAEFCGAVAAFMLTSWLLGARGEVVTPAKP
jgi:hypothetical protein